MCLSCQLNIADLEVRLNICSSIVVQLQIFLELPYQTVIYQSLIGQDQRNVVNQEYFRDKNFCLNLKTSNLVVYICFSLFLFSFIIYIL